MSPLKPTPGRGPQTSPGARARTPSPAPASARPVARQAAAGARSTTTSENASDEASTNKKTAATTRHEAPAQISASRRGTVTATEGIVRPDDRGLSKGATEGGAPLLSLPDAPKPATAGVIVRLTPKAGAPPTWPLRSATGGDAALEVGNAAPHPGGLLHRGDPTVRGCGCPSSSQPAATRVSTPVAATPGERQPRALASHRESGCEQAPRRVRRLLESGAAGHAGHGPGRPTVGGCAPLATSRGELGRGRAPAFARRRAFLSRPRLGFRRRSGAATSARVRRARRGRLADRAIRLQQLQGSAAQHHDRRRSLPNSAPGNALLYRSSGQRAKKAPSWPADVGSAKPSSTPGRTPEAETGMFLQFVSDANYVGLLTEEIGLAEQRFVGNLPRALTHLAVINAATTLDAALEDTSLD